MALSSRSCLYLYDGDQGQADNKKNDALGHCLVNGVIENSFLNSTKKRGWRVLTKDSSPYP
jgi:hypothetical protein